MTWHPRPIGEVVLEELGRFGAAGAIGEVVTAWPDAVGPAIAANAWPARVARDGTLVVTAGSSVWAFELTKLEETIRARLAERLGARAPARLRFAVGRLPERGETAPTSSRTVPEASEAARRAGREIAAGIESEALREAVARAAAASLTRRSGEAADRPLW